MAILLRSTTFLFAFFLLLLGFLSTPTTARPCKTLFITFTIKPVHRVHHSNPSFIFIGSQNPTDDEPSFTIISEELIRPDNGGLFLINRPDFQRPEELEHPASFLGMFPLLSQGIDFDSLIDRSKDVLSVAVALLFGVGCGAVTAATMYFVWMLVVGRADYEDAEEYNSDYDDIPSPKKCGYIKILADAAFAEVKEVA